MAEVISACAGGAILTAWGIYLDASPLVTGTMLALSQLAQLFQLPAAWTTSRLGSRRACIWLVGASRQAMLPLAALPFLPLSSEARQHVLLAVAFGSAILGVLGNNAWVSWMSELVPQRVRGRYFGKRSALCTMGGALAAAAVGVLLDGARARGAIGPALAALQVVASLSGVITTLLMLRQHEPAIHHARVCLQPSRLLASLRDPTMRGLLTYLCVWNGAVGLAGSFFALHMVRNLKMSFTLVALHGTAVAAVRMLVAPVWGALLDRIGARPVLVACSFGIATVPFIWLLPTEHSLWPLALDCVVAGVLWCGHSLATFHLPLSITPRAERPLYLALFATVTGVSFSLATFAGGSLAELLPDRFTLFGSELCDLHVLFVLSGVLRALAAVAAIRIREPAAHGVDALLPALRAHMVRVAPVRQLALRRVANENGRAPVPHEEARARAVGD